MQLWRIEQPVVGSMGQRWVCGGVWVYKCIVVGGAPVFRRYFGKELWVVRELLAARRGEIRLCRGVQELKEIVRE